jgi:nitroimidazol reductase NimA-like FMN-containing flavoprotein (pyridoxamine 5'-phosphate oxidase superfamily)
VASWGAFARAHPSFGALALARIDGEGLVMVGTLRRNGWPRISPVEPLVLDGELYLGMMHRSRKAVDLLRDSRCVVHSIVHDKGGAEGDVKVYGRAVTVEGPAERERSCRALEARIGWRPEGEFHLFTVDITEVGYFAVAEGNHHTQAWKAPVGPP